MSDPIPPDSPADTPPPGEGVIVAAVYPDLTRADAAVDALIAAGFTEAEISVVCSDEAKEEHFRRFDHEDPAGDHTGGAAVVGGVLGLAAGGLAGFAALATGGLALVGAGAIAGAGAVAGSFLGVMLTRGEEGALSDFYDQAVREGHLLIGVEVAGDGPAGDRDRRAAEAERLFTEQGGTPIQLDAE